MTSRKRDKRILIGMLLCWMLMLALFLGLVAVSAAPPPLSIEPSYTQNMGVKAKIVVQPDERNRKLLLSCDWPNGQGSSSEETLDNEATVPQTFFYHCGTRLPRGTYVFEAQLSRSDGKRLKAKAEICLGASEEAGC